MKRKPVVFLSHSKRDKVFIQKIAGDLRNARIDCWYDDWEIPPGEPFMRKIFDEGLPESDLFFVYLSENTISSYWVEKELDSAILLDKDKAGGFMATFVDSEATRSKLRLDLKTIHTPIFNETEYFEPFYKLLSRCWEGHAKQMVAIANEKRELELVRLQRENEELRLKIVQTEQRQSKHHTIRAFLEKQQVKIGNRYLNLKEVLLQMYPLLQDGIIYEHLEEKIGESFKIKKLKKGFDWNFREDIIQKLFLTKIISWTKIGDDEWVMVLGNNGITLTDLGNELVLELLTETQSL